MELIITILAFVLIFGLLIFVHEFGHFIVAKRAGIKVEEFAFGLPLLPRLWGIKRGETTYGIYPVPLGGFVRMLGEDGADRRNPRSFGAKSARTRAAVLVAGVTMNVLLAVVLLTVGFFFKMQPLALCANDYPGAKFENKVTLAIVADPSPAHDAGLKSGDQLKSIAGNPVTCGQDVPKLVGRHPGEMVPLVIVRDGKQQTINVTPKGKNDIAAGKIGVSPRDEYTKLDYPRYAAPLYAVMETVAITKATIAAIGNVFVTLFQHAQVPPGVSGPVGIAKLTGEVVVLGWVTILRFIAVLSLSLAVFNILPIPALDGGRLFFVFVESLRGGKPITPKLESAIHATGFALLILFIAFVTYFDLTR